MQYNRDQSGFSAVEAILILVVVGIIGFTGWFVYKSQSDTSKTLNTAGNSTASTTNKKSPATSTAPTDEIATWTPYTSANSTFTFRIPDGWKLTAQTDADLVYGVGDNIVYKAGTPATVTKTTGGRDGLYGFFIAFDSSVQTSQRTFTGYTKVGDFKTNTGLTGTEYTFDYTSTGEGIGPDAGTKEYAYYFTKNNMGILAQYDLVPGASNQLSTVEKAIKTINFNTYD